MSSRIASELTTCALFSVRGVTDLNARHAHLPQVLLWLVLVVLVVQAVPQYCSHPVLVHPISKALYVENPYTKHYISHRFLEKSEIHTISPELLDHPSLLLDPSGDKKKEKKSISDLKGEIMKCVLSCFTKSFTAVNFMYRMINSQLSQNTHGAN